MSVTRAPRDAAAEEAALRGRIAFLRRLRGALDAPGSVASQTVAAYTDILDGAWR